MDIIMDEGKKAMDIHLSTYNERVKGCEELEDKHLAKRWEDIVFWAMEEKREDRQAALRDLRRSSAMFKQCVKAPDKGCYNQPQEELIKQPRGRRIQNLSRTRRLKIVKISFRALSREFADGPSDLAHFVGESPQGSTFTDQGIVCIHPRPRSFRSPKSWTRFPFDVAMGRLGEIKAKKTGSFENCHHGYVREHDHELKNSSSSCT